jgi:HPt (histidine-containing phosphotransfer) domain-containing protein
MKSPVTKFSAAILLTLFVLLASAKAGPPLICHSFEIGSAKSLPWVSHDWKLTGTENYNVSNLVSDTTSILETDSNVLVHMETLRRAVLYSQNDPALAKRLLLAFLARSDKSSNTPAAALANFDAGYLAETFQQYQWISRANHNPAHNFDGYALFKKALQLRPNDPQMEFAAALIAIGVPGSDQQVHAKKAMGGAASDPLLARNLATHFISPQSESMATMISRNSNTKVAHQ